MRSLGPEDIMPCWYYDKKEIRSNTPSVRDGIDPDVEARYRKEGTRFITDTGNKMGLRHYETLATGSVYFHRFYMSHSFKQFPRYVTACCCLFLAGKVEETPKKCKDIIKAARSLLNDQQFAQFGEDPKEEVMTLERILLQTMKFDLQVDHPYKYLLRYAKCLKGEKEKLEKMVQMAWTFVNDSLYTTLCLQWEPEIIAIALMYLATKLSKFEVSDWNGKTPKQQRWWDMYVEDISIELLEDVCHQVLDIYSNSAKAESPPPTTPPQSSRHGRVRTAPNNDQQNPSPLLSKKPTLTPPAMPSTVVPQPKTLTIDPTKMDPMMLDPGVPSVQMQSHLMPGQSETSNHISVIHNYKYPVSMTGIPEGFVPPQYVPSPNAPYATFGELQMPGQAMIDGSYSAGYYESGAFPTTYVNTIQPPNTATMPPHYPGAVALHYLTEPPGYAHQGGRPVPNPNAQFASGVYPPTGYPPPHYSSSPVPPVPGRASVHQGLQRGAGASRLTTRQATHSNWGV